MPIKEIQAKSILRKNKKIESWFLTCCGMNLYRGCEHNCSYCDGRSEKYQVEGEFGKDVFVKVNAIELLRKELNLKRIKLLKKGFVGLGGGVGDSYQPAESKYKFTRKTLTLLYEKNLPVHILTKSILVKRDIDILKKINKKSRAIVSFSFSSADEKISSIFEPGVPSPEERFQTISNFKNEGICCGMYLMPVIPFITDKKDVMKKTIEKASEVGIDFIIFGGMTLKEGRQKDYFYSCLKKYKPELLVEYNNLYKENKWGSAIPQYYHSIQVAFNLLAKSYKIPMRIPPEIYTDILTENDLIVVILEHIDYILKSKGRKSPYGFAAYSISKISTPLSQIKNRLREIKGVGPTTEKLILEILETKRSAYYEKLLFYKI